MGCLGGGAGKSTRRALTVLQRAAKGHKVSISERVNDALEMRELNRYYGMALNLDEFLSLEAAFVEELLTVARMLGDDDVREGNDVR